LNVTKVADVIRAEKSNIVVHDWKEGKIPATHFPLTRPSRLRLSVGWRFRLVTFEAMGAYFVVLIKLNREKCEYSAILAVKDAGVLRVLCHHDLHGSHKNFHCHFATTSIENVFPGVLRDYSSFRAWEDRPSEKLVGEFDINEEQATSIAAKRFRFERTQSIDETTIGMDL
jgi:hypothetical protein